MESVPIHKISIAGNYVKFQYFMPCARNVFGTLSNIYDGVLTDVCCGPKNASENSKTSKKTTKPNGDDSFSMYTKLSKN